MQEWRWKYIKEEEESIKILKILGLIKNFKNMILIITLKTWVKNWD